MTFKRKLAVMLMFGFDGNSLRKKKEGIKEDAKIKSYFLFNYKKHHHHFTSQLLSLLKCLLHSIHGRTFRFYFPFLCLTVLWSFVPLKLFCFLDCVSFPFVAVPPQLPSSPCLCHTYWILRAVVRVCVCCFLNKTLWSDVRTGRRDRYITMTRKKCQLMFVLFHLGGGALVGVI